METISVILRDEHVCASCVINSVFRSGQDIKNNDENAKQSDDKKEDCRGDKGQRPLPEPMCRLIVALQVFIVGLYIG